MRVWFRDTKRRWGYPRTYVPAVVTIIEGDWLTITLLKAGGEGESITFDTHRDNVKPRTVERTVDIKALWLENLEC